MIMVDILLIVGMFVGFLVFIWTMLLVFFIIMIVDDFDHLVLKIDN